MKQNQYAAKFIIFQSGRIGQNTRLPFVVSGTNFHKAAIFNLLSLSSILIV